MAMAARSVKVLASCAACNSGAAEEGVGLRQAIGSPLRAFFLACPVTQPRLPLPPPPPPPTPTHPHPPSHPPPTRTVQLPWPHRPTWPMVVLIACMKGPIRKRKSTPPITRERAPTATSSCLPAISALTSAGMHTTSASLCHGEAGGGVGVVWKMGVVWNVVYGHGRSRAGVHGPMHGVHGRSRAAAGRPRRLEQLVLGGCPLPRAPGCAGSGPRTGVDNNGGWVWLVWCAGCPRHATTHFHTHAARRARAPTTPHLLPAHQLTRARAAVLGASRASRWGGPPPGLAWGGGDRSGPTPCSPGGSTSTGGAATGTPRTSRRAWACSRRVKATCCFDRGRSRRRRAS
jgi:hypothetical protein